MAKQSVNIKSKNWTLVFCRALLCLFLCLFMLTGFAQAAPAVELVLLSEPVTDSRSFTAELEVKFNDLSYYKEGLYLSYHVYDSIEATGQEIALRYENMRISLVLDAEGKAMVALPVDVTALAQKQLFIQYDIVDTVDLFWFSGNENVGFSRIYSTVSYSWWKEFFKPIVRAISETPVVFILNLLVLTMTLITIGIIKKRKLLKF